MNFHETKYTSYILSRNINGNYSGGVSKIKAYKFNPNKFLRIELYHKYYAENNIRGMQYLDNIKQKVTLTLPLQWKEKTFAQGKLRMLYRPKLILI
jgi:hypothetical protein